MLVTNFSAIMCLYFGTELNQSPNQYLIYLTMAETTVPTVYVRHRELPVGASRTSTIISDSLTTFFTILFRPFMEVIV